MKVYQAPIEVKTRRNRPYLLKWEGQVFAISRVLDYWVIQGRWWQPGGEVRRVYFRVVVSGLSGHTANATAEVYREDDMWTLYAIHD